jgi:hypothetical protein
MRAMLARRIDIVVVIWALALGFGWSFAALSHSQLTNSQWSSAPQAGPVWVVADPDGSR